MRNFNPNISLRVTALWAFSEAFLGGILHGFKLPFTGLILALFASLCMSLIAVTTTKRGSIIKATLVVLAVKFILSPHTPLPAYLAVMIQGFAGELLFIRRKTFSAPAFFLTLFSLVYSAFQHLFVLTLLFGREFWQALDIFLNGITKTFMNKPQHYSLYLVIFYIGCYLVVGILGGIMNARIVRRIYETNDATLILVPGYYSENQNESKKSVWHIFRKYLVPLFLLTAIILSYTPLFSETLLKRKAIEIMVRGLLILLTWHFVISPLLTRWISAWVKRYRMKNEKQVKQVLSLLPDIRRIVFHSWSISASKNKWRHITSFISNTALLIVYGRA